MALAAGAGNGSGRCSISIAEQSSYAPCILGRSFGCTNAAAAERSPSVWVRGCRGRFLLRGCSGKDETGIWCGYPPGASSYNCSCAGRSTASWPRAPHLRSRRADRTPPAKTETVANAESLAALLFSSKMVESTDCGNGARLDSSLEATCAHPDSCSSCSAAWARYDCNRTQRATTGRGSPLCSPLCTRASVLDLFQVVEGTSWRTHHVMRSTYGAGCFHKCNGQFGALRLSRADAEHLRMGLSCPRQPARPPRTGGELVLHYPYNGGVQTLSGMAYVKFEPLIVSRGRKAVNDGFLVWRSPFNPTPAPSYTRLEVYRIPHKREGVGYGCWSVSPPRGNAHVCDALTSHAPLFGWPQVLPAACAVLAGYGRLYRRGAHVGVSAPARGANRLRQAGPTAR